MRPEIYLGVVRASAVLKFRSSPPITRAGDEFPSAVRLKIYLGVVRAWAVFKVPLQPAVLQVQCFPEEILLVEQGLFCEFQKEPADLILGQNLGLWNLDLKIVDGY